jgi:hypothetical protein
MMDWSAALAGSALLSSIGLALALFVGLGFVFGYGWRTGAVAVLVVVAVNLFCTGGAPQVIATALRPLHTLATTRHLPEPPEEKPSHWPNG